LRVDHPSAPAAPQGASGATRLAERKFADLARRRDGDKVVATLERAAKDRLPAPLRSHRTHVPIGAAPLPPQDRRKVVLRLPEPMLARSGLLPHGRGWLFEPKLDGYRCLVCTHAAFRARSRRGWNMTPLLPEFAAAVPANIQLDGELVALDRDGRPDFHRLSERMLHGRAGIAVTLFVFDVLPVEGLATTSQPYSERRALLEELDVEGPRVRLVATFERPRTLGCLRPRPRERGRQARARPVPAG
jgi:ATP-dependent DNA ligase